MKLPLGNNEEEPEVSMSPLIDCVFLLLIFFLVSTMTKVKSRDIPVNLPTSEAAVKLKPDISRIKKLSIFRIWGFAPSPHQRAFRAFTAPVWRIALWKPSGTNT